MFSEEEIANKQFTEEERLELGTKLDAQLAAYLDGLEKKRYEEGWPEDRWQEEMDKHPFFMKKAPQPGDEVHPMFEGLQKLKYDPEENTAEDLALNYKEDGNFYMKHKKFRMAIYSFNEGLKAKCEKPEVLSVLYNNRSAAHFFLKNYRSSLEDAQKALEYKPDYNKSRWRAAQCAFELKRFDVCSQLCDEILENDAENKNAQELRMKNKIGKSEKERNDRKEAVEKRKKDEDRYLLYKALKERNIKYAEQISGKQNVTAKLLKPKFFPLEDYPVHLDSDYKTLIWPAGFSYPEFLCSDFQQNLSEKLRMSYVLDCLFTERLPEDKTNSYRRDTVNVYYDNCKVGCFHKVDLQKTIKEITQEEGFFVSRGSLLFFIVPKDSKAEQDLIHAKK